MTGLSWNLDRWTIKPEDALAQAAQIPTQHLRPIAGVSEETFVTVEEEKERRDHSQRNL